MEFICHHEFFLPYSKRIITGLNLSITIGTSQKKSMNRSSVCSSPPQKYACTATNNLRFKPSTIPTKKRKVQAHKIKVQCSADHTKVVIKRTKSILSRTGIEPVTDGFLGTRQPLQSTALPTELSRERLPSMRIELTTLGLLDPRSNQLSYEGLLR